MMLGSVASALAEAWETGTPVAPLSAEYALGGLEAAEDVAGEVLEKLGLVPCGIRVTEAGLVGVMLPGRIVTGVALPLAALPHAWVAPAILAVLAEAILPDGTGLPALARLHPAMDVASSRWRDGPANALEATADLAGLGHVVIGRGRAVALPAKAALELDGAKARAVPVDVAALFARAVQVAREAGGLPAGAVLVLVAGGGVAVPKPCDAVARWTGLGKAEVSLR